MASGYHIGQCGLAPGCVSPICTLALGPANVRAALSLHYNGAHPAPVMVGPWGWCGHMF